jgi:hypothetical protein
MQAPGIVRRTDFLQPGNETMSQSPLFRISRIIAGCSVILVCLVLTSCTSLLTGMVIEPAVGNLQKQQDVDLVCEGAASYLLMIDSLIESDPLNRDLLLIGIKSYSGTVAALSSCGASPRRISALADKAKKYGQDLLSMYVSLGNTNNVAFDRELTDLTSSNAPYVFWGTFGWLTWVGQQHGSPAAMADLITIEKLMVRLLAVDETIENGSVHLFFGVLYGAKPKMIGGDPERSRDHFERALEISARSFLMVQATYAETYGRMVFNKELHDTLLQEVIAFPIEDSPDNTLSNQIAKRKAHLLLEENFFGD